MTCSQFLSLFSACALLNAGCTGPETPSSKAGSATKARPRSKIELIEKDPSGKPLTTGRVQRQVRYIMGTLVEIVIYDVGDAKAEDALEAGFAELQKVDDLMSTYKEESELSRINREASEKEVAVSPETFFTIERGLYWARESHGAFDPTVYPLVQLWRQAAAEQKLPAAEKTREALACVGYEKVQLDPARRTVHFKVRGVSLDLGGLGKGYGVDLAVRALRNRGVRCAVVNAGGKLYAFGQAAPGRPPLAGIRHPIEIDAILGAFPVQDAGVATSGNYERFYEIQGKKYCHIFDPRTGQPVPEVVSATVVASNGTDADALATALFVLGPREGMALVKELPDTEALILTLEPGRAARLQAAITPNFRKRVQWNMKLPGL